MVRHFHRVRGVRSLLPSGSSPQIDGQTPPLPSQVLDFSPFFKQSIHEAVLTRLRGAGFECDADVAGLTAAELEAALKGFIDDEEAGWYIDVARGALRQANRCQPHVALRSDQLQLPTSKRLKPAVLLTESCAFKWSRVQTLPEALKYCQGQANMIEVCWDVYQAMGSQGALWSPLAEADPLAAKEAFCKKLQVFEEKTLGARLSCLRRWNSFLVHHNGARALLSPDAKSLYAFLKEVDGGGPTAAASVFQQLRWWKRTIGLPFPLEDPLLGVWNRPGESHTVRQRQPLSLHALETLCRLASGAYTNLATFASFGLIPLFACLRFAHVQRSKDLSVDHDMVRAVCYKGKSRKRGVRPAFEWAAPLHAGEWKDVLGLAVRAILALREQEPSLSFCIPDLVFGSSGRLDASSTWSQRPMSRGKFVDILRSVLLAAGISNAEVQTVSTYSLRRFLPSVAEVLRTPPEVARHLGNWSESVSQKHHEKEPLQMAQLYAHDRVLTAGHSKSLLLQVVCQIVESGPKSPTLQTIAQCGWTWPKALDKFVGSLTVNALPVGAAESEAKSPVGDCESSTSQDSSSSLSDSESLDVRELHWFRLPRGVVHLIRAPCKVSPTPYCRQSPFPNATFEWGSGITPGLDMCSRCLASAPSHISRVVRALHAD